MRNIVVVSCLIVLAPVGAWGQEVIPILSEDFESGLGAWTAGIGELPEWTAEGELPTVFPGATGIYGPNIGWGGSQTVGYSCDKEVFDGTRDQWIQKQWTVDPGTYTVRLEYDIVDWGGFWIQLQGADLSPYSQLVFDVKAGQQEVPEWVKIELKRAGSQQISILRRNLSEITTNWQTMAVDLSGFRGSLSSFTDVEELVFTFEANGSRKTGVIYLDNISLRRE